MKQKERPQVYNNPLSTTVRSGGSTKTGDLVNEYRDHLSLGSKAPDFTLADLNGNGLPEVVIGSDDNLIHIVDPSSFGPSPAASEKGKSLEISQAVKGSGWKERLHADESA